MDLIQTVEKALYDLSALGNTGALKNPLVTKSLESKLPEGLKKEWLVHLSEKEDGEDASPEDRFDLLLKFLRSQERIYEQLDQLRDNDPSGREATVPQKHASTRATNFQSSCVVCGERGHRLKLYYCKKFKTLEIPERKEAVEGINECGRCLDVHDEYAECKTTFLCKNEGCKNAQGPSHHFYLCPKI